MDVIKEKIFFIFLLFIGKSEVTPLSTYWRTPPWKGRIKEVRNFSPFIKRYNHFLNFINRGKYAKFTGAENNSYLE